MPRHSAIGNAIAVVVGLALSGLLLGGIESAVRLRRAGTLRVHAFFSPDHQLVYRLNPRIAEFQSSFRGPGPAADGSPPLAVCLGGSTTFGIHVRESEAWPRRLEAHLARSAPAARVLNAGVPGYGSRQLVQRYDGQVAALDPRYVVIYEGWNGTGALVDETGHVPAVAARPGAAAPARLIALLSRYSLLVRATARADRQPWRPDPYQSIWEDDMERLVRSVLASGRRPVLVVYPALYHEAMSAADLAAYRAVRLLWPYDPRMVDEVERKHRALRRIALETPSIAVDAQSAIAGLHGPERAALFVDEMHLSRAGHELVAALVARAIADDLDGTGPSGLAASGSPRPRAEGASSVASGPPAPHDARSTGPSTR